MRLHKKLECSIKLIMTVVLCTLHKHLNFEFELGCCYLIKDITLHIVSAVKHNLETVKLSTCILIQTIYIMCVRQFNVCLGSFLTTINILIYNNLIKLTMYGIVLCNYGSVNYTQVQVICTLISITHNINDNKTTISSSSSSNTIITMVKPW